MQDFSAEFTHHYLLPLLQKLRSQDSVTRVVVQKAGATGVQNRYCRMILHSGQAVINTGWIAVVKAFKLNEGDICMFSFHDESDMEVQNPDSFGIKTRLLVLKIEQ